MIDREWGEMEVSSRECIYLLLEHGLGAGIRDNVDNTVVVAETVELGGRALGVG